MRLSIIFQDRGPHGFSSNLSLNSNVFFLVLEAFSGFLLNVELLKFPDSKIYDYSYLTLATRCDQVLDEYYYL